MKKLTLISITLFLLTNIIYSQDIINETGKDGKFIVRDNEQKEALIIEDGNVAITGELSVKSMPEGSSSSPYVVWDTEDKKFKTVARVFSKLSPLSEPLDTRSWHSIGYDGLAEDNITTINANVEGTAAAWNQFDTDYGYIKLGPANQWWAHLYTDMPAFIFNKPFYSLDGSFGSYTGTNFTIKTWGTTRMTILESNGNVGIGTESPTASLQVNGDDGLLVQGTWGNGVTQSLGAGIRMHFYPKKAAFRAGYVNGTQWDDANIGGYSTAMGANIIASGYVSTAMGLGTTASGQMSTAMGYQTLASGFYSTAMGYNTTASTYYSTAMGGATTASGYYSTAMGAGTTASGYASTAMGRYNVGGGSDTTWVSTDPLFEIGIGANSGAKANAMTVLKNGRVGIGTATPSGLLDVNGSIYQRGGSLHADYVFEDDYELESIQEHADFMWTNKHLSAIPKGKVDENGNEIVEVGAHRKGIVEELEKAHIYISQMHTNAIQMQTYVSQLEERITKLEQLISINN